MRRVFSLALLSAAAFAPAQTTYLGLYLMGSKIGYTSYTSKKELLGGVQTNRSDSKTVMSVGLMGTGMTMTSDSISWTSPSGKPILLKYRSESSGRVQTVEAVFGTSQIVARIENSGRKSTKTLKLPVGKVFVDDPLAAVIAGQIRPGSSRSVYVLDPSTVDLVKNEVKVVGKRRTKVGNRSFDATLVEIVDPRATMRVFIDGKGEIAKVEGPMGIEMLPVSRAVALAKPNEYTPAIDLATATSLRTDKPIPNPESVTRLKMRVTGRDMKSLPSDEHQTVTGENTTWIVDVHPVRLRDVKNVSIAEAAKGKPEWLKPGLNLPSDSPKFRALAKTVVGDKADVKSASLAVRRYVYSVMRPNAGIGVLRDASEVLETKEGVCRDYAVLTVTLLRAAGIPARLASGLVNWDGTFYYHAWAEAWAGDRWLGLDSTADKDEMTATHVKLAHGSLESAFTFTFLDKAKLELLDARKD